MAVNQVKAAPRKSQSRPKKKKSRSFNLIERKFPHRKFVEFPQMKGRTVEKIEFYTVGEYHSVSIDFQDKTLLHLRIDPCFLLNASFSDNTTGTLRTIKEWPPIPTKTNFY